MNTTELKLWTKISDFPHWGNPFTITQPKAVKRKRRNLITTIRVCKIFTGTILITNLLQISGTPMKFGSVI
jgi:hypothetical protein